MHNIEPFYLWNHIYDSVEDKNNQFYVAISNEVEYNNKIYNLFFA